MNEKVRVPTTPPIVAASGLANAPWQKALLEDIHDSVEHSALLRRRDGVWSVKANLTPTTENTLLDSVQATLATALRELTTGAGSPMPTSGSMSETIS